MMSDYYIDYDETQRYGTEFAKTARGMAKSNRVFLHLAEKVEKSTEAVGAAIVKARKNDGAMRKVVADKRDVLPAAERVLREAYYWARANPAVDVRDFFPKGRAKVGHSATAVFAALVVVAAAFGKYGALPGALERKTIVDNLAGRLRAKLDDARAIKGGVIEANPELMRARVEWRRVYGAAKLVVEGVLRLEKPTAEVSATMKQLFPDLNVRSPRSATKRATGAAPTAAPSAVASSTTGVAPGNGTASTTSAPSPANN
jgi:hypothetical protein